MYMDKLNFSGHESFLCRELWLKKGFDFVKDGKSFQSPSAVTHLGVGKNMVNAIKYWITSFNLLDKKKNLTPVAEYIFGESGKDPFLEDDATLWLLHYYLVKTGHASLYSLFFNIFRRERPEFTKEHLFNFLKRKCEEKNITVSDNSIRKDINVLISSYWGTARGRIDSDDLLNGMFLDLVLIEEIDKSESKDSSWYRIVNRDQENLPEEIILYCILDNHSFDESISFNSLLTGRNSVGSIFALSGNGLVKKLKALTQVFDNIVYTDDAGIREIQFKDELDKWEILDRYYNGR